MKKIFYILTACFTMSAMISCSDSDFLDINKNPNEAVEVDPDLLFGYATTAWSGARCGGDHFLPIGFMNQSIATGGNYGWGYAEDRYDISPYSIGNTWRYYYVDGGNNLKQAISLSESQNNNNAKAQSQIVLANGIYEATMIWGDIPYSQAWTNEAAPKFDSQEDVLNNLLSLIDDAISSFDINNTLKIGENDPIYKGDITKWIKYAKSLKLKILMTMVDKDPSKAAAIGSLINSGGMISSSNDNALLKYYDETNHENPKYKIFKVYAGDSNPWIMANNNVFSFMEALDDPRIPIFFTEGSEAAEGEYIGVDTATDADSKTSVISLEGLWKADADDIVFSLQEQLLFEAEIYARGIGVAVDLTQANAKYKSGVEESLRYYGVSEADISDFINNSLPDISGLPPTDAIKEIHIQQWVDLMDRSLEGWVQNRRSGSDGNEVPNLSLPSGAPAGGIMRRWDYPNDEMTANSNSPSENPEIFTKMWFDL